MAFLQMLQLFCSCVFLSLCYKYLLPEAASFLGAFPTLGQATVALSYLLANCPHVLLGSRWKHFHASFTLRIFAKSLSMKCNFL